MPCSDGELRVLTYNIKHAELSSLETIAEIILSVQPDIVGLQEIDQRTQRSGTDVDQAARLGELTGMQSFFGRAIDYGGGAYGLAVLVSPDIDMIEPTMTLLPQPEGGEQRGVIEVGLSLDADPSTIEVRFFDTHFCARSETNRIAEGEEIVRIANSRTEPLILVGDLNAGNESTPLTILGEAWTNTGHVAAIDYILHDKVRPFRVDEIRTLNGDDHPLASSASDHPSVFGRIVLGAAP